MLYLKALQKSLSLHIFCHLQACDRILIFTAFLRNAFRMAKNKAFVPIIKCCTILSAVLLLPLCGSADTPVSLKALEVGSSMSKVAGFTGEPDSKIERETGREEVWVYHSRGRLLFREGILVSVVLPVDSTVSQINNSYDNQTEIFVDNSVSRETKVGEDETHGFLSEVAETTGLEEDEKPSNGRLPQRNRPPRVSY
jgi:hypothetical protein